MCAAGKSRQTTFQCGRISSSALEESVQHVPRQLVVHADADDVVVEMQALIARKSRTGRRIEIGFVLQSNVEILHLRRPIPIELNLETAARGPAPMPLLVENCADGSDNLIRDIGKRAASCGVDEPVVARVADTSAEGGEPPLADFI